MASWVITIPKTTPWSQYQKELATVADSSQVMNYRTRYFPKGMKPKDRCYLVHDGRVRGWMAIVGLVDAPNEWTCTTTGQRWPAGKYIQRSGKFHPVDGPEMTGFRGVRKFEWMTTLAPQGTRQLWTRGPLSPEQEALLEPFLERYELLGRGGHRAVFQADDPGWILKVALTPRGRVANELESVRSLRYGKTSRVPFADCHLSTVLGTEVLMMEWVQPYNIMDPPCCLGELPEWVQWVDFVQVGWDNQGNLVAYDFERLAEEAGYK